MVIEKDRKPIWLTIAAILWGVVGILCSLPALMFMAFYDQPLEPEVGMGLMDWIFISSVISFPAISIAASLGIFFLKDRNKKLAFFLFLLPLFSLTLIYALFSWAGTL